MLRLGHGREASEFARYVAERWIGPDHDEAVQLWNEIPVSERVPEDQLSYELPKETETAEGKLLSTTCTENDRISALVLDTGNHSLTFHSKSGFTSGFSDTIWYGEDHFSLCHHLGGLHAVVRYKPPADGSYAGELAELEVREELPASGGSKTNAASAGKK